MIDLYYLAGAASLVVLAALEKAGAEYNLIPATRENGLFGPPKAAKLNLAGRVPTMPFDGIAMTESVPCQTAYPLNFAPHEHSALPQLPVSRAGVTLRTPAEVERISG
ncbi:MAG: hypothetical protein JO372_18335 [Solirubrobacterales bacterium]|nr:hypothetical protein [Solirubrobacterales bacterium]